MNNKFTRRGLFGMLGGMVAAKYLPKPKPNSMLDPDDVVSKYIRPAAEAPARSIDTKFFEDVGKYRIGQTINVRIPPRFIAREGLVFTPQSTLKSVTLMTREMVNTMNSNEELALKQIWEEEWTPSKNNYQIKSLS